MAKKGRRKGKRERPRNREREIEDAIIRHPKTLGFPRARAIRNVHLAWKFGRIDVMLLSRSNPVELALIEAKHIEAHDATSKVIGQLLMYYAGALRIGKTGLDYLNDYATRHRDEAESAVKKSPKKITGGLSPPARAWAEIQKGRKIHPSRIKLFVAMNAQPREALCAVAAALEKHHELKIGLVVVDGGRPRLLGDL